jgi:hypothetical protein
MSLVSQYRNSSLRRSSSNPAVLRCLPFFLIAAFIALPSTAKADGFGEGTLNPTQNAWNTTQKTLLVPGGVRQKASVRV